MRLLLLADIHGKNERIRAIFPEIKLADMILVAGDLTDFGGAEEASKILSLLRVGHAAIAVVPGNCDRIAARRFFEDEGVSTDGRLIRHEGALVVGSGGGVVRTGLTPYERTEEEIDASLEIALNSSADYIGTAPLIILTHTPPHNTEADIRRYTHTGSLALRALLDEVAPPLWVSGHIHESRCVSKEGTTVLVNPGPLHDGFFAIAEIRKLNGAYSVEAMLHGPR